MTSSAGEAVGAWVGNGVGENVLVASAMFGTIGLLQLTPGTVADITHGAAVMTVSAAKSAATATSAVKVNRRMSESSLP